MTNTDVLNDFKKEIIEGNDDKKLLMDYIDGRIEEAVQQSFSDTEWVSKEDVENMIRAFNDR